MSLKTMELALQLRASLCAEIDGILAKGVNTHEELEKVMTYRAQLKQADALMAALEDLQRAPPIPIEKG